jgi:transposase, IS6 family
MVSHIAGQTPARTARRSSQSYRNVDELLAERGITVDHVTIYRWVQRCTLLLIDAARPGRHAAGGRWCADETSVKIAGRGVYLYRAIDQYGQVIDVLVATKRDLAATRPFFTRALKDGPPPSEVTTDRASAYPRVLDELVPAARHITEQYATDVEAAHSRLKARLWPMRGLKRLRLSSPRRSMTSANGSLRCSPRTPLSFSTITGWGQTPRPCCLSLREIIRNDSTARRPSPPCAVSVLSRRPRARPSAVDSIEVETDKQTAPSTPSSCPGCAGTPAAATTSNAASPKAGLLAKRSAA